MKPIQLKKITGNSLIAALIIAVYIFSPLPFLIAAENNSGIVLSYFQYATPAMVGGLIFLLLLQPNRQIPTQEKISTSRIKIIRVGAFSGFIASLAISAIISLSEVVMNLPNGIYFSVLGTVLGITTAGNYQYGLYLGWVSHLLTGTVIGSIFGAVMSILPICDIRKRAQTIVMGLLAGFSAFIIIFNPISRLGIEPSLVETLTLIMPGHNSILISNTVNNLMSTLLVGSIVMHIIYGSILGTLLHYIGKKVIYK